MRMKSHLLLGFMALMLAGCSQAWRDFLFSKDISGLMPPGTPYETNFEKGAIYRLRRDVFVGRAQETEYCFCTDAQSETAPVLKGTLVRYDKMEVYRVYTGGQYALPMVTCLDSPATKFGLIDAEPISTHVLNGDIPKTVINSLYLEKVSGPTTSAQ